MVTFGNSQMNNRRLEQILLGLSESMEGSDGCWEIQFRGRHLMVLTDESHNRMRVMTPIVETAHLPDDELLVLLSANFDRALDAKFAIARGYVWALYVHPLRELTESQLSDAVSQVATLADNYGSSYSSSEIVFGSQD